MIEIGMSVLILYFLVSLLFYLVFYIVKILSIVADPETSSKSSGRKKTRVR